jgi:hypothetical protein
MGVQCGTRRRARSGVTAVLAMLYLTLMASLALGFYSASNTAVLVSTNEQRVERARLAAESGLDFARFHLGRVSIPAKISPAKHFSLMCDQLSARMNGSGNLNNGSIYVSDNMVRVPADPNQFIKADDKGAEFQFTITDLGNSSGAYQVRVTALGRNNLTASAAGFRTVRLDFELQQNKSKVFQYGIATRGTVSTSGNSRLKGQPDPNKGSILALDSVNGTPVSIGGKLVTGDISVTNPDANVSVSGASVGGTTNTNDIQTNHVHKGVDEPEFPTVDTSMFIPYAVNKYVPGKGTYSNIIIPPNTNPSFNAGTVLKGVVYIQQPNQVTFNGSASIQGVIVTDTDKQVGNLSTNTLKFTGSFNAQGVESLDPSYGSLRDLSGSFILMPNFSVTFTGNFDAQAHGNIVVDQASMTGSSSVKLDGSLMILKDTPMTMGGNSELTAGDNAIAFPSGLKFSNRYQPLPSTYEELKNPQ